MPLRVLDRRDDALHLALLRLREAGHDCTHIGALFGLTGSRVRTITNRIRDDYAASADGADAITFPLSSPGRLPRRRPSPACVRPRC